MSNHNLQEILDEINISEIKSIVIRTVGLIDVFGKMIIDIEYNDDSNQSIEILSPVPTVTVTEWLDTNTLLDKTVLYEF